MMLISKIYFWQKATFIIEIRIEDWQQRPKNFVTRFHWGDRAGGESWGGKPAGVEPFVLVIFIVYWAFHPNMAGQHFSPVEIGFHSASLPHFTLGKKGQNRAIMYVLRFSQFSDFFKWFPVSRARSLCIALSEGVLNIPLALLWTVWPTKMRSTKHNQCVDKKIQLNFAKTGNIQLRLTKLIFLISTLHKVMIGRIYYIFFTYFSTDSE